MRVIIVEGGDGSGKSTLVDRLSRETNWPTVHMSVPEPIDRPFDYWFNRIIPFLHLEPEGIIIDRLHWSEDAYGNAIRGKSQLGRHERWALEGWLLAHEAFVIRCQVDKDTAWKNVSQDPSAKHHDRASFEAVYDAYEEPWVTQLPVITYDYRAPNWGDLWHQVFVKAVSPLPARHQGIGSATPLVLLVGERHNSCKTTVCDKPVVFEFGDRSGGYLRQALAVAGLDLTTTHITNAYHGRYLQADDINRFRSYRPRTVALGKAADKALNDLGIVHQTVPHPMFWKRFCYSQLDEYAALIKEAAC